MKRSPTSLLSNPIIGLIFGRQTTYDIENLKVLIKSVMVDAAKFGNTIHYLEEHFNSPIFTLMEEFSKEFNVRIVQYESEAKYFNGDMRAARRAHIDAILNASLITHIVTIRNDANCSLTKIVNDSAHLQHIIKKFYVRSESELKEAVTQKEEQEREAPIEQEIDQTNHK